MRPTGLIIIREPLYYFFVLVSLVLNGLRGYHFLSAITAPSLVQHEVDSIVHNHLIKTIMNISKINNIGAIESFLEGSQAIVFAVLGDKYERYKLVQSTLIRLRYITLSIPRKGIVIRFLIKITGYSRQHLTPPPN
jgi:hypothetical protein